MAAGVARQINFVPGELPYYSALGALGAQGPDIDLVDADLRNADAEYGFVPGKCIISREAASSAKGADSAAHTRTSTIHRSPMPFGRRLDHD